MEIFNEYGAFSFEEVELLVFGKDVDYGKSLLKENPDISSFTFSVHLIHMLKPSDSKHQMYSAVLFISRIGGVLRLLEHLKYGFQNPKYVIAAAKALLILKGGGILHGQLLEETEVQMGVFSQTGTLRIKLSEVCPWIERPHTEFFLEKSKLEESLNNLEFGVDETARNLIQKENRELMKKFRMFESFFQISPPWVIIRGHMNQPLGKKLLTSFDSVKSYLAILKKIAPYYRTRLNHVGSYLGDFETRMKTVFQQLNTAKPLLEAYHELKTHATKPGNRIWLWGWSSADRWYYSGSPEIEIILLRIRFEIWRIIPSHELGLSAIDYEFSCLELIKDNSQKDSFRSKIYYDLFLFLDAQSGKESIDNFVKCLNLTASYANSYQLKQRINSMLEGLKRLDNGQMYSNCVQHLRKFYGNKYVDELFSS